MFFLNIFHSYKLWFVVIPVWSQDKHILEFYIEFLSLLSAAIFIETLAKNFYWHLF